MSEFDAFHWLMILGTIGFLFLIWYIFFSGGE